MSFIQCFIYFAIILGEVLVFLRLRKGLVPTRTNYLFIVNMKQILSSLLRYFDGSYHVTCTKHFSIKELLHCDDTKEQNDSNQFCPIAFNLGLNFVYVDCYDVINDVLPR